MTATTDNEIPLDPVEALLADCLAAPDEGRDDAVEAACREHPELADELRVRLALLAEMEATAPGEEARALPEQLGDFRLLERIGGGGMGVVWLAEQISLGREVALKLLRPGQLYFPGALERFHRESKSIARLQHPGIVPIYTVGEHEGLPYFAMERVVGCTLAEVLRRVRGRDPASLTGADMFRAVVATLDTPPPFPAGRPFAGSWTDACCDVIRQVALALEHAHERGVLHRDLKPSNILLRPDGCALLCDFGLSSDSRGDRVTREGSQLGTVPYMSPEQAAGAKDLSTGADVYGLGVTLYELLSLQLPFRGENAPQTLALIERGEPDSLRPRNRGVSVDVETVCLTAMERDLARRYPSAAAVAHDLQCVLERRPIRARPAGPWLRLRRSVQRRPALAAAVVLGVLLLVGLPTQRWWHERARLQAEQAQSARVRRELELTQATNHFVLALFRRAASLPTEGRPLTAHEILALGPKLAAEEFPTDRGARARVELLCGRLLYELRANRAAEPLVESALAHLEAATSPVERRGLTTALQLGAQLDVALGRLDRAEHRLEQLAELWNTHPPESATAVASADDTRALLWLGRGDTERAEELLNELVLRAEARPETSGDSLASSLGILGSSLLEGGDPARARPHLERAIALYQASPGAPPAQLCALHSNLGLVHKSLGEFDAAASAYERAIEIAESIRTEPNATHATLLVNLGALLDQTGDAEGSLVAYSAALDEQRSIGAADSRGAMVCGISIGAIQERLGRWEEADRTLAEWHGLQQQLLGTSHPFVAETYARRARSRSNLGDLDGALQLCDTGLETATGAGAAALERLRDQLLDGEL